jgi:hypothetical protein
MLLVFHQTHTEENPAALEKLFPGRTDDGVLIPNHREPVVVLGPNLISHPDGKHLYQTALGRANEVGMGFNPVDGHDAVGFLGKAVEKWLLAEIEKYAEE